MKIKSLLTSLILFAGMALGQSQFSGGGGNGAKINGSPVGGNCASWLNATTLQDAGGVCGGAPAFSSVTTGTNTTNLFEGTGGSLTPTGSGTIGANVLYSGSSTLSNQSVPFAGAAGVVSQDNVNFNYVVGTHTLNANNVFLLGTLGVTGVSTFGTGSFSGNLTTNMTGGPFCVHETSGVLSQMTADCSSPAGASFATQYNNSSAFGGYGPGITNQVATSQGASAAPIFASIALIDSINSPVVATPYTIACDNGTTTIDRATTLRAQSGAATFTVPLSSASGCGGMVVTVIDDGGGTLTFNRTSPDSFTVVDGATNLDAQTSFTITNGQSVTLSQNASGLWLARKNASGGNLSNSGTPLVNQIGVFVDATHVAGSNFDPYGIRGKVDSRSDTGTYAIGGGTPNACGRIQDLSVASTIIDASGDQSATFWPCGAVNLDPLVQNARNTIYFGSGNNTVASTYATDVSQTASAYDVWVGNPTVLVGGGVGTNNSNGTMFEATSVFPGNTFTLNCNLSAGACSGNGHAGLASGTAGTASIPTLFGPDWDFIVAGEPLVTINGQSVPQVHHVTACVGQAAPCYNATAGIPSPGSACVGGNCYSSFYSMGNSATIADATGTGAFTFVPNLGAVTCTVASPCAVTWLAPVLGIGDATALNAATEGSGPGRPACGNCNNALTGTQISGFTVTCGSANGACSGLTNFVGQEQSHFFNDYVTNAAIGLLLEGPGVAQASTSNAADTFYINVNYSGTFAGLYGTLNPVIPVETRGGYYDLHRMTINAVNVGSLAAVTGFTGTAPGTLTFTNTGTNNFQAGTTVQLYGFTTLTAQQCTVLAAGLTNTTFECVVTGTGTTSVGNAGAGAAQLADGVIHVTNSPHSNYGHGGRTNWYDMHVEGCDNSVCGGGTIATGTQDCFYLDTQSGNGYPSNPNTGENNFYDINGASGSHSCVNEFHVAANYVGTFHLSDFSCGTGHTNIIKDDINSNTMACANNLSGAGFYYLDGAGTAFTNFNCADMTLGWCLYNGAWGYYSGGVAKFKEDGPNSLLTTNNITLKQNWLADEATSKAATCTVGNLACYTANNTVGDCGQGSTTNLNAAGIIVSCGPPVRYVDTGQVSVNNQGAGQTWVAGHNACTDPVNNAVALDNGFAACGPTEKQIGIIVGDSGAVTTHPVTAQIGDAGTSVGAATNLNQIQQALASNTASTSGNFNITWPSGQTGSTDFLNLSEASSTGSGAKLGIVAGPGGPAIKISGTTPATANPGVSATNSISLTGITGGAATAASNGNGGNGSGYAFNVGAGGVADGTGVPGSGGNWIFTSQAPGATGTGTVRCFPDNVALVAGNNLEKGCWSGVQIIQNLPTGTFPENYVGLALVNLTAATAAGSQNSSPTFMLGKHVWAGATPADTPIYYTVSSNRATTLNAAPNMNFLWRMPTTTEGQITSTATTFGAVSLGSSYDGSGLLNGGSILSPNGALGIGGTNAGVSQGGSIQIQGNGANGTANQWDTALLNHSAATLGGFDTSGATALAYHCGLSGIGGTDTNKAGGNCNQYAGTGTGTGAGGIFTFFTTQPGGSGTTQNTPVSKSVVGDFKTGLSSGSGTNIASFPIAADQAFGAVVKFSVIAHDTTNHVNCTEAGQVTVSGENSAGVFVVGVDTAAGDLIVSKCTSGSTLSLSFAVTGANPAVLSVTPTLGSLTPTSFFINYNIETFGDANVTP